MSKHRGAAANRSNTLLHGPKRCYSNADNPSSSPSSLSVTWEEQTHYISPQLKDKRAQFCPLIKISTSHPHTHSPELRSTVCPASRDIPRSQRINAEHRPQLQQRCLLRGSQSLWAHYEHLRVSTMRRRSRHGKSTAF